MVSEIAELSLQRLPKNVSERLVLLPLPGLQTDSAQLFQDENEV